MIQSLNKSNGMKPKERVMTVLAHKEPDRVPVNYSANQGIDVRLKQYFGLKPEDYEGLLEVLGVDFRGVYSPYNGPKLHAKMPGINVDPEWGIQTRWIEHSTGGYWDYCNFPLRDANEDDIAKWPMPSPDDYNYTNIIDMCSRYKDYAIHLGNAGIGDIINSTGMLRSMEQVLIDLALDEPAGLLLIDRKLEVQLKILRKSLEAGCGKIDFLWMGEDLGTQYSPMLSKELFRKHIRPRQQKIIDLAKEFGLPVMIHTCGSSSWAYEDFIEMGITAVDTLQPEAKDMDPLYLKKNFGGRLAFHGCISTAGPVAYGSTQNVRDNVRETLKIMMPGGGYCMAPTHSLQDNSPVENVVEMYKTAHEYGIY